MSLDDCFAQIDAELTRRTLADPLPGLVVGVVRDQTLVWSRGYGAADRESGRPPDARTLFRVASITKTFTATAVLQLRDAGLVALDDPLVRHLPEFGGVRVKAGAVEQATLRRLMAHHAGLATEAPLPCWAVGRFPDREALLKALPEVEITLAADSAFKYSNLAYGLLGETIQRVTGRTYSEYLQTEILTPLGMTSSGLAAEAFAPERLATGYFPPQFGGSFAPAGPLELRGLGACGQLYSCVEDLARWIAQQFRCDDRPRGPGQVLDGRSLAEMHRPYMLEPDWSVGYGLGWRAVRSGDRVDHGHGGGLHGFASYVLFCKALKLGVVALANVWPHLGLGPLAADVATRLIAAGWRSTLAESPFDSSSSAPRLSDRLACGLYEALPGVYAQLVWRDGRLRLEGAGSTPYLLHAPAVLEATADPDAFVVRGGRSAGETARLRRDARGDAVALLLSGFVYRRLLPAAVDIDGTPASPLDGAG